MRILLLVLVALHVATILAQQAELESISACRAKIKATFDRLLADPTAYQQRAKSECASFPEGDLFPYVLPAIGYSCINYETPSPANKERAKTLIGFAITACEEQFNNKILNISRFNNYGTHLSHLNLAISVYTRSFADNIYAAVGNHISGLLIKEFQDNDARQITSYPAYTWSYDSTVALLSLQLNNNLDRSLVNKIAADHIHWLDTVATDPNTELPYSVFRSSNNHNDPRGCELSLRIAFAYHLDKQYAARLYKNYCQHFWLATPLLSGFCEWPDAQSVNMDVDSGPILFGIGATATAAAYPIIRLFGDEEKEAAFGNLIQNAELIKMGVLALPMHHSIPEIKDEYFSGLLYAECLLFYSLTWAMLPCQ